MNNSFADVFERLSFYAKSNTDVAIAKLLNISRQAIANARKRDTIPFEKLYNFAIKNEISLDYLLLGKGTNTGYAGQIDPLLLDGIEMEFKDYIRTKTLDGVKCDAHDMALIYNRVINQIKPDQNWAELVEKEVHYLIQIRLSDIARDKNGNSTPLLVHEEEQNLLKRSGSTVSEVYGEECLNPTEYNKSDISQTISDNNHQVTGRDVVKDKKGSKV